MAPQKGKKSAKQQTTNNVLKRKPFHRFSARQQEKVSKKQAKTATLKEQPTDVIQAGRRNRKARFKAKRKLCAPPLTAEEVFDQDIWATYKLVQAECQPSKVDLLAAAAAEPDKQVEIKAIHTAYNQVLNGVVHRCVTSFVRRTARDIPNSCSGEFTSQDRDEYRSFIVRLQRLQLHLNIDEKALAIPNTSRVKLLRLLNIVPRTYTAVLQSFQHQLNAPASPTTLPQDSQYSYSRQASDGRPLSSIWRASRHKFAIAVRCPESLQGVPESRHTYSRQTTQHP